MTSFDLTLYLVTDRRMPKEGFETVVEEAIRGGVTLVQLREKEGDTGLLYERARRLKEVTDRYHIPLIIDDRIDIMLAVDAAGVHVGQSDMPAAIARQMIGPDKILGVSAANLTEALKAEADGADYLGVGAMLIGGSSVRVTTCCLRGARISASPSTTSSSRWLNTRVAMRTRNLGSFSRISRRTVRVSPSLTGFWKLICWPR